jgi:DNA-binding response OmpR family regulator
MPETAARPAPRPTVLVVEDEALVAMLVEDVLAEAGYGSVLSPDGDAASGAGDARADAATAAAAVVDLRLAGGLDGREVVRDLRARRPALPVVVITGFHPEAAQADLRGLGGPTLRLCKPFDCDDLAGGVSAVLDAPAPPAATPRRRRSDRLKQPA